MGAVRCSVAALASLLVGFPLLGSAATWRVDDDGVDYPGADFTTIQAAINAASPGDTILVYPGTYDPPVNVTPPGWGGTYWAQGIVVWKDNLTIRAVNGPTNTLIESTFPGWMDWWRIQRLTGGVWTASPPNQTGGFNPGTSASPSAVMIVASGVTIEGFTIRRPHVCPNIYDCFWNTAGVMIGGVAPGDPRTGPGYTNPDVRGNTVKNCVFKEVWHAVYVWHSSANLVENNVVEALGAATNHWAAIQIYDGYNDTQIGYGYLSKDNVIRGNTIADKGIGFGAWLPNLPTDNSGTVIRGNTCTTIGIYGTNSTGVQILDNTVSGSIWTSAQSATKQLVNATVSGNVAGGIQMTNLVNPSILTNTISAGTGTGIYLQYVTGGILRDNSVTGRSTNGIGVLDADGIALTRNSVTGNGAAGITLVRCTNLTATSNTCSGNPGNASNPGNLTVREGCSKVYAAYNTLSNGTYGLWVHESANDVKAECNNIFGNSQYGIWNNGTTVLDGRFNWWGAPTGPSGGVADPVTGRLANGMGDKVSANVRFDPWLNAPCPGGVAAGSGDVNADGKLDILDAELVYKAALGLVTLTPAQAAAADVNGDGVVNQTDAQWIAEALICRRTLPTCPCCP